MSDEDDILAAEHALGLADAAARVEADPAFAAAVETWRARLLPMMGAAETPPPPELWAKIAGAIPAAVDAPAPPAPRTDRWRIATFVASAAAAVLALLLVMRPGGEGPVAPPAPTPVATAPAAPAPAEPHIMVAALMPEAGNSMVSVTFDDKAGQMTVMPMRMDAGGKSPELWMIPADGKPRSLGVIPEKKAATMRVAPAHRAMLGAGVMLAVSLEPAGGSPTGLPTGPVVMKGKMQLV